MLKKILEETREEIIRLYDGGSGLSAAEIARQTGVSYSSVYGLIKAKEGGFASQAEYREYLAKKRGFASQAEYAKHLTKRRGFASQIEYLEHLAKKKGFASFREYKKHLAKERGFASQAEYAKHLTKERQQRPLNQELSDLIQKRLEELGQTQKWLAERLGITEGAVSRYISGRTTPRKSLQGRLFEILELPHQTLDNLLE